METTPKPWNSSVRFVHLFEVAVRLFVDALQVPLQLGPREVAVAVVRSSGPECNLTAIRRRIGQIAVNPEG